MIITCISDTHGKHSFLDLPGGDLLIHAGDFTKDGSQASTLNFLRWLKTIKKKYDKIICVPGNHDKFIEYNLSFSEKIFKEEGVDLLVNKMIEYKGKNFYGSPYVLQYSNFAFGYNETDEPKVWANIPSCTDILITHCPPYLANEKLGIKDPGFGRVDTLTNISSIYLGNKIIEINRIKLHVFGHCHDTHGRHNLLLWEKSGITNTLFINASICDELNNVFYPYEMAEVV